MPDEIVKPTVPTAELVMKICLTVSVVIGSLLILLALVGHRSVLSVSGSVVAIVAVQSFFYLAVRTRRGQTKG